MKFFFPFGLKSNLFFHSSVRQKSKNGSEPPSGASLLDLQIAAFLLCPHLVFSLCVSCVLNLLLFFRINFYCYEITYLKSNLFLKMKTRKWGKLTKLVTPVTKVEATLRKYYPFNLSYISSAKWWRDLKSLKKVKFRNLRQLNRKVTFELALEKWKKFF